MTLNVKEDLIEGNKVELWGVRDDTYSYLYDVSLINRTTCREELTFIHNESLYAFECWIVTLPDGFKTSRKVYYRVSDDGEVPEELIKNYTYNLEYESKEYLRDKFEHYDREDMDQEEE